jgi:hypothetical protein
MFKLQFVYLEPRNKNEEQLNEKLNYLSRSILCSCVFLEKKTSQRTAKWIKVYLNYPIMKKHNGYYFDETCCRKTCSYQFNPFILCQSQEIKNNKEGHSLKKIDLCIWLFRSYASSEESQNILDPILIIRISARCKINKQISIIRWRIYIQ